MGELVMKKAIVIVASLGIVSNLFAQKFELTLNCQEYYSFKHVKVVIDVADTYEAKNWAKEHGKELCEKYYPASSYVGIYDLQYK